MMWPVAEFYNGSNELAAGRLRLAAIFRERGRDDLASCVVGGRKAQRFFFALGTESSFLDTRTLPHRFAGLQRVFSLEGEKWQARKSKAFKKWRYDDLLLGLLDLDKEGRWVR
jgi:hypothetical protein